MYSPSGHEDVDEIVSSLEEIWWNVALNIALNYLWIIVSCLDSHSDGTHSLQRIHWWASDGMLNFPNLMKKQTYQHLNIFNKYFFLVKCHFTDYCLWRKNAEQKLYLTAVSWNNSLCQVICNNTMNLQ